jgi:hypothetical protein
MQQMPLSPADRQQFLLGGNATFTLVSTKTSVRYTYKVQICDSNENLYFVKVMTGSDNESDYTYLGTLRTAGTAQAMILAYGHGKKSRIAQDAPSAMAFAWFIGHLESTAIEMWHEGRCCVCGRKLTDPMSISRGIGPECQKKMAMVAA